MTENSSGVPPCVVEEMEEIRRACERGSNLTRQLLLFSRKQVMQLRDLDLNETVTNITKMLRRIIGENISIQTHLFSRPLIIYADAGMLDQVLLNLAINARDAMNARGLLSLETTEKEIDAQEAGVHSGAKPGKYVCLTVSDSGCGISPDVLPHIFEPFFTTKEKGKGTGLGLATVFGIVKQHEGWIDVRTEEGKGTTFEIYLPENVSSSKTNVASDASAAKLSGTETILLAEDDFSVRKITVKCLEASGYKVLDACSGVEALSLWEQYGTGIDLLLTDVLMPDGLNGRDLGKKLQFANPNLKVIYLSGYSADLFAHEGELRSGENFLQKPYSANELLHLIRRQFDS